MPLLSASLNFICTVYLEHFRAPYFWCSLSHFIMRHLHFLIQLKEHSSDLVLHLHKAETLARDLKKEQTKLKLQSLRNTDFWSVV